MKLKLTTNSLDTIEVSAQFAFKLYGFKFYVHRGLLFDEKTFSNLFTVSEITSGAAVPCAWQRTKKQAIKKARKFVIARGKTATIKAVDKVIKQK